MTTFKPVDSFALSTGMVPQCTCQDHCSAQKQLLLRHHGHQRQALSMRLRYYNVGRLQRQQPHHKRLHTSRSLAYVFLILLGSSQDRIVRGCSPILALTWSSCKPKNAPRASTATRFPTSHSGTVTNAVSV